ncbi:MAG: trypsin-like peptidase domain-containing protein [Candidatus Cloacimonadaceae bacterium]|nr:trypsin-like peptidase domain-containing protein [Candidatus Cloacimonadaceae bacterium]
MRTGCFIVLLIAVIIINAGVTIALINQNNKTNGAALSMFGSTETKEEGGKVTITGRENSITRAVREVEPAIVSVNVFKTQTVRGGNPFGFSFFDFFDFAPMQRQVQSIGTGVIYDSKGFIITNAHVVSGANQIRVVLPDKREFDAQVIGMDERLDIAKLKINGNNLPHARLGTSRGLIIGEWAIALGNPYGFLMNDSRPSVSVGVISALNRNFAPREDKRSYRNMIQTDAAVNPGNSGGPLVNINGEVIGINTFIVSESGGNIGIGFAIPIDRVKEIVNKL